MSFYEHIEKLKYFTAIAEAGSIIGASKKLRISQPHLTRVVHFLEAELGLKLIVRSQAGISLTTSGARLVELEKLLKNETQIFEREIRGDSKLIEPITVGTYSSIARYFFPSFLEYMHSLHPKFTLNLEAASSLEITKRVLQKKLKMGLIVEPRPKAPYATDELDFTPIYHDQFALFSSIGIPLKAKQTLIYFKT